MAQLSMHITQHEDIHLWKGSNNKYKKRFSTKETLQHIRGEQQCVDWYKGVWFPHATPKYSFSTWLAAQNRLSTEDRMQVWSRGPQGNCVLCTNAPETRDHLFFACDYTADIWGNLASNLLGNTFSVNWYMLLKLAQKPDLGSTKNFLFRYCFQTTAYHIWRERNNRRHGELGKTKLQLIKMIDKNVRNRLSSLRTAGDHSLDDGLQVWFATRPP